MSNEYTIFGPPGSGKSRTAAKNINAAVEVHGFDRVLVASHTKAAATEIAGRGLRVEPKMVGTLHALCFRALGHPKLAEPLVRQFNAEHPDLAIGSGQVDIDDPGAAGSIDLIEGPAAGDRLSQAYQLARSRMVPRESWPDGVRAFAEAWEDFKAATGTLDYTDLLETAWRDLERAPGDPAVGFIDECQDLSALQYGLVRKWSIHWEKVVMLGDDDQTLYVFSGADPEHMLSPTVPEANKIFLRQSHRVPKAVHDLADRWIRQVAVRQDKAWEPRDAYGSVDLDFNATWRTPERLVEAMATDAQNGHTVMLLATCSYLLEPAIGRLRDEGIPFHNPYRLTRGDWNPWRSAAGSTTARVAGFLKCDESGLSPDWTYAELKGWLDLVSVRGVFPAGFKAGVDRAAEGTPEVKVGTAEMAVLRRVVEPLSAEVPWSMRGRLIEWLEGHVKPARQGALRYVAKALVRDPEAATAEPKLIVGTIHSVKGGEADVVYVLPDLSRKAWDQWSRHGVYRDAIVRTFYVSLSRAFEAVKICRPGNGMAVRIG